MEPKEPKVEAGEDDPMNGDIPVKNGHPSTSPSLRNGNAKSAPGDDDQDELDDTPTPRPGGDDETDTVSLPPPSSPISDISNEDEPETSGARAARRKAMALAAAERSAQDAERKSAATKQRAADKEKKAGSKHIVAEKKRLLEEGEIAEKRLHELEYEFRSAMYTLRARPLGLDRFGNKVWWMDGLGSAPLGPSDGNKTAVWGTGRVYVQGPDEGEMELLRLGAVQALTHHLGAGPGPDGQKWEVDPEQAQVKMEDLEERRTKEEGEGKMGPGEWGVYDTPESVSHNRLLPETSADVQLASFISYLSPKGVRELALIKTFKQWLPDIEAGMRRRRVTAGLDEALEEDGGVRRVRLTRKAAGDEEGWMSWKVSVYLCPSRLAIIC